MCETMTFLLISGGLMDDRFKQLSLLFLCASFTIFTCIKAAPPPPPPEEFEITDNWDFVYLEIIYG